MGDKPWFLILPSARPWAHPHPRRASSRSCPRWTRMALLTMLWGSHGQVQPGPGRPLHLGWWLRWEAALPGPSHGPADPWADILAWPQPVPIPMATLGLLDPNFPHWAWSWHTPTGGPHSNLTSPTDYFLGSWSKCLGNFNEANPQSFPSPQYKKPRGFVVLLHNAVWFAF